ncbi:hypothetical protein R5R35_014080 [Gryllus longicercus]|uniref:Uncharacterized protein n=1 Tax=Gryllus longicercus TaxID=2509291 RepID=A0AAN9VTB0_9ORTH
MGKGNPGEQTIKENRYSGRKGRNHSGRNRLRAPTQRNDTKKNSRQERRGTVEAKRDEVPVTETFLERRPQAAWRGVSRRDGWCERVGTRAFGRAPAPPPPRRIPPRNYFRCIVAGGGASTRASGGGEGGGGGCGRRDALAAAQMNASPPPPPPPPPLAQGSQIFIRKVGRNN